MQTFKHVFQPEFEEVYKKNYRLKGYWHSDYFMNNHPIVLELGCGKGEYTVGLAREFHEKNFIGVDIKGARMWKGARIVQEEGLKNVAFIRTRIELINSFFAENEINEIWITFPDPQLKKKRNKKRLTAPRFLNSYKQFLVADGCVHLKTDSEILYEYTLNLIRGNNLELLASSRNIHADPSIADHSLSITTFYETFFLDRNANIKYLCFKVGNNHIIHEPEKDE